MEEFEEISDIFDEEIELDEDDELKLAEIYRLATKLVRLLEGMGSHELKESASLMLIREIVGDDKLLLGLASKMLQDINYGFDENKKYCS